MTSRDAACDHASMSACPKCGEVLIGSKKFCAYCGAAATAAAAPAQASLRSTLPSSPPAVYTAPAASPPQRISGLPAGAPSSGSALPPTVQPNTNPSPPYASSFPAPFAVGSQVLVQWADGNRYPGIVQQIAPGQCLVVFTDGQQRWVDNRYLASASAR
jgi:hypothetical protein